MAPMSGHPAPRSFDAFTLRFGEHYKWMVLTIAGLGMVAGVLSTTSFSVAVPALSRHFALGQDQVQWAITGFMAAMTIAMLPTPWLIDRLGLRRVFLLSITLLAISSAAGSLASSFAGVVLARLVQGVATGMLQPLGTLVVMRLFPPHSQGRASGVLGFGIVLAPAVAPALGGALLDHFGWQAIFLINLPFCLLAGVLGLLLLPSPRAQETHRRFNWTGLSLLSVSTLVLIEGVASLQHSGLTSPWTLAQGFIAAASLFLFIRHARHHDAPLISLALFRERSFTMGSVVSFSYGFGLYASTYLIPVFLQNALGYSAGAAGMALLPSGIALAITISIAGRLADHHSPVYITMAGLALFGLSFALLAIPGGQISYAALVGVTILGRVGLGLILPALSLAALRHLAPHQLGQSSMVVSYTRQVGGVLGIAIAAVFVQWRESVLGATPPGVFSAYTQSFLLLAATFVIACSAAARMNPARPAA